MSSIASFFSKQVVRIMGIILLILLALFIFNQFSPFIKTKYTLGASALGVKEVRDIGELISAEYYGEIIHSLSEGYGARDTSTFHKTYETLKERVTFFYTHFEHNEGGLQADKNKVWEKTLSYFQKNSSILDAPIYIHLLRLSSPQYADLKKPRKGPELHFFKTLKTTTWKDFIQNKNTELRSEAAAYRNELMNRVKIDYLCRGWVKAGYDLTQLQEGSMDSISVDSILIIENIDPYILAADINPWFIPPQGAFTEGVPGYELLRVQQNGKDVDRIDFRENGATKKVIPFRLISQTKKTARIELIRDALERGIFQTAQSSAEESIFQLIRMADPANKRGIKAVKIINSPDFSQKMRELEAKDNLDLSSVDSLQHYIHLE